MKCVDALNESYNVYRANLKKLVAGSFAYSVANFLAIVLTIAISLALMAAAVLLFVRLDSLPLLFTSFQSYIHVWVLLGLIFVAMILAIFIIQAVLAGGWITFCTEVRKKKDAPLSLILSPKKKSSLVGVQIIQFLPTLFVILVVLVLSYQMFFTIAPNMSTSTSIEAAFSAFIGAFLLLIVVLLIGALLIMVIQFFLMFAMYSVVLDGKGAVAASAGSIRFVRNNFTEALVLMLLFIGIGIAVGMVNMVLNFIVNVPTAILTLVGIPPILGNLLTSLINWIINVLVAPFFTLAVIIFYTSFRKKPAYTQKTGPASPA